MLKPLLFLALTWNSCLIAEPRTYTVNPADSYIHIYTDSSGVLRAFSHKHLIAITQMEGNVVLSEDGSQAWLRVNPEHFLVDDKAERARAADPEFREPVDESIQTGTRENMLSQRLLDVEHYPEITMDIQLDQLSSAPLFDVAVHILGKDHQLQIPAILTVAEQQVRATGYVELTHADLGLEPFTAMGGLLRVAEGLRLQFEIVAQPSAPAE